MLEIRTKNNNFKMNIPEELSDYLFTILVSTTTNTIAQMKIFKPEQALEHPERAIEQLVNIAKEEVAPTNVIEETIEEIDKIADELDIKPDNITKKIVVKEVSQEEPVEEKRNRLVVTICPKCGRRHTIFFNGNRINCTCGHYIDFTDEELVDGSYDCHHCGEGHGHFKVLGQVDHIACVKCKGGIMLDYDTATGTFKQVY